MKAQKEFFNPSPNSYSNSNVDLINEAFVAGNLEIQKAPTENKRMVATKTNTESLYRNY
jgi:hypothetical protein